MIIGLFLRHYKVYKNINFIPITTGAGMTAYLGQNGAGKSSILDALDKYFNGGDWSINIQEKLEGGLRTEDKMPYIVPVFCIEKYKLQPQFIKLAEVLSNHIWKTNLKTTDALTDFYSLRKKLIGKNFNENTHLLIPIGRQHNQQKAYLGSFQTDSELMRKLDAISLPANKEKALLDLMGEINEMYSYFYIPVESDAAIFSKIESTHVQKLLDKNIQDEIRSAIGSRTIDKINESLGDFIREINDSLEEYKYKGTYKDRLTMNDLVDKVFEAYFIIKVLHKSVKNSSIPIREMSAGEKRRALLDLCFSLLQRKKKRDHNIILAIDEPDASLHASACHDHFSRLSKIPELTEPRTQVLITTHWYGFLPIIQNGIAHSLYFRG